MRLTPTGIQVELDKILFKVGTIFTAHIQLGPEQVVSERARSIKHYENFFRNTPNKILKPGEEPPQPKSLCELHFVNLTEPGRLAISKYLLKLLEESRTKSGQKHKR